MKEKKQIKKLNLEKINISTLSKNMLGEINGGDNSRGVGCKSKEVRVTCIGSRDIMC